MTWSKIFLIVTGGALVGMIFGGLFGLFAGIIAPGLFANIIPWSEVHPLGAATVFGAFGGVMCGGALAAFSVILQFLWSYKIHKSRDE